MSFLLSARASHQTFSPWSIAGSLTLGSLLLSGCASQDPFAQSYSTSESSYTDASGAVSELSVEQRQDPITFSGKASDSTTVSSEDFLGNVLVVNFWYAGCAPCRSEIPHLQALYEKHAEAGVQFLGVNLYDAPDVIHSFEREKGVTYPSVVDRDTGSVLLAFSKQVPPKATPTTLVLDRDGRAAARIVGAISDPGILDAMIRKVLAE